MARIESVAVGGYYKTPTHLVPWIASYIEGGSAPAVCDPCAADGEAVKLFADSFGYPRCAVFSCELEQHRAKTCIEVLRNYGGRQHHWDAFQIRFDEGSCNLLYLNPPYELGKLEKKFLDRFEGILADDGILVYIIPHYALSASREILATKFTKLSCVKFPDEDYAHFKQVVLFGVKTNRVKPDPAVLAQVDAWAQSTEELPVLALQESAQYTYPYVGYHYNTWETKEVDFIGLSSKFRPWRFTAAKSLGAVPHILPEVPVSDLLFREYPVVTLPRPAHIAAGIASGMFNGRRVEASSEGFSPLLVKGVFDREFEAVREIENKEGDITGVVEAQKPKLVTTVFDLNTREYKTLRNEGRSEGLETIEDLLAHYSTGLMDVMGKQCPVQYNPDRDADSVQLAPLGRKLYDAQEHASKALVQLLRTNQAGILIGEIGSGKTSCALAVARTLASNLLVMCPPHLLDSWKDEVRAVLPEAEVRVLETVSDVDDLVNIKDKFFVALLSREDAKLGHALASVEKQCPKCGSHLLDDNYAKKRSRCEVVRSIPQDFLAEAATQLAKALFVYYPNDFQIRDFLNSPIHRKRGELLANQEWKGVDRAWLKALTLRLANMGAYRKLLVKAILTHYDPELIREIITESKDQYTKQELAFLLPPGDPLIDEIAPKAWEYQYKSRLEEAHRGVPTHREFGTIRRDGELWILDELVQDSKQMALVLFHSLCSNGSFTKSEPCGEFLYQSTPKPRRFPLAKYISTHYRKLFKFFVADECHEYATEGSAQEKAGHRICNLNLPTILMTGSLMNGYAESLFTNMWAVSREFRREFPRTELSRFVDRYGYRERIVSDRDEEGSIVAYGSCTDRVTRSARVIGDAPGILPLFLFRHLLKVSVTLHKADLDVEIPPCTQHKHVIQPTPELAASYKRLLSTLLNQISRDRFDETLAGKLFGALSELPSYLDRAATGIGNQDNGNYEIRYPKSVGASIIATGDSFPASELTPKERWMVDTVISELKEGRNVMVFAWHINVIPRLERILSQELGEEVPVLKADKVPTKKRQAWIQTNVIAKRRRVMIANPMTIQTGLNNLIHFSTEIWMENPGANPQIFRQAIGRIHRLRQKRESRVHFPIYAGTIQVQMYDLLMKKVAISTSTDGLDPESVLLASGGSSSYMTGLSIGRQLWEMLSTPARSSTPVPPPRVKSLHQGTTRSAAMGLLT